MSLKENSWEKCYKDISVILMQLRGLGRYGMTCEVALANKLLQFLEEFICHLLLYLYKILKKFRKKYIAECSNIKKYAIEVKY